MPSHLQYSEIVKEKTATSAPWTTVQSKSNQGKPNKIETMPNTTCIILTDSVLREVKPEMISPNQECEIIKIGGASSRDMINVINNSEPNRNLQSIYIHCGFKDSKDGVQNYTKGNIYRLCDIAREKFPSATCYISATLPAKNNKNRVNIDEHNEAVREACDEKNCVYIDLLDAITTESHKIQTRFFFDMIHLNADGAKAVATILGSLLMHNKPHQPKQPAEPEQPSVTTVQSESVTDQGNVFKGFAIKVNTIQEVREALTKLHSDPEVKDCTSLMYCYRINPNEGKPMQDYFDDREHGAGKRILEHLKYNNSRNILVAVSRKYNCHIHGRRWNIIDRLTSDVVQKLTGTNFDLNTHRSTHTDPSRPQSTFKQPTYRSSQYQYTKRPPLLRNPRPNNPQMGPHPLYHPQNSEFTPNNQMWPPRPPQHFHNNIPRQYIPPQQYNNNSDSMYYY